MTDDRMALRGLLEKSADTELLREMIGFAAGRLMELEVQGLTGAGHGERSPERLVQRNGYRDRDWETRAGTVELVGSAAPNPQDQEGLVLSGVPGAAAGGREGADGGSSKKPTCRASRRAASTSWSRPLRRLLAPSPSEIGSSASWRMMGMSGVSKRALGQAKPDPGEPGLPAVRGDRRARRDLPGAPARGRLALPLDRRHLSESPPERPHRLGRRDHRRRGQQRWAARGPGHGHRRLGGRSLLAGLPTQAQAPGSSW